MSTPATTMTTSLTGQPADPLFQAPFVLFVRVIEREYGGDPSQITRTGPLRFLDPQTREFRMFFNTECPAKFNRWRLDRATNLKGDFCYMISQSNDCQCITLARLNPINEAHLDDKKILEKEASLFFHLDGYHTTVKILLNPKGFLVKISFVLPDEQTIPETYRQIRAYRQYYFTHCCAYQDVSKIGAQ